MKNYALYAKLITKMLHLYLVGICVAVKIVQINLRINIVRFADWKFLTYFEHIVENRLYRMRFKDYYKNTYN